MKDELVLYKQKNTLHELCLRLLLCMTLLDIHGQFLKAKKATEKYFDSGNVFSFQYGLPKTVRTSSTVTTKPL